MKESGHMSELVTEFGRFKEQASELVRKAFVHVGNDFYSTKEAVDKLNLCRNRFYRTYHRL